MIEEVNASFLPLMKEIPGFVAYTQGIAANDKVKADKAVVGNLEFTPDPADGPTYDVAIKTDRRATTVEWIGCKTDGQPRYR